MTTEFHHSTNERRADRAEAALRTHTAQRALTGVGLPSTDPGSRFSDLLTDLIHLAARLGLDFDAEVESAVVSAAIETAENGPVARRDDIMVRKDDMAAYQAEIAPVIAQAALAIELIGEDELERYLHAASGDAQRKPPTHFV